MAVSGFERRLERMVEGIFARAFRSGLRPVEVGRRLQREMDDNRSVGVDGRTVVPNHFEVRLSAEDFERFREINETLRRELAAAAREHAHDEGYTFLGPVGVDVAEVPKLRTGTFEVVGRLREGPHGAGAGSLVLPGGERIVLDDRPILVGRLPECEITINDPNVSRRHAEVRPQGDGFVVVDLGSTNGTRVNGAKVTEQRLTDGDELGFGNARVVFEAS